MLMQETAVLEVEDSREKNNHQVSVIDALTTVRFQHFSLLSAFHARNLTLSCPFADSADGFMNNVKAEKAKAMIRYRRLQKMVNLFRCVEFAWLSSYSPGSPLASRPIAFRISGQYFWEHCVVLVILASSFLWATLSSSLFALPDKRGSVSYGCLALYGYRGLIGVEMKIMDYLTLLRCLW